MEGLSATILILVIHAWCILCIDQLCHLVGYDAQQFDCIPHAEDKDTSHHKEDWEEQEDYD